MRQNDKQQRKSLLRELTLFSQIGINMASCVLLGVFAGQFLDRRFNTSPWLLLVFSLAGVAAAYKALFDWAKRM